MQDGKAYAVIKLGVDHFARLIDQKAFYIDKTKFIADIIRTGSEVYLFTRPRGFGKSLNVSMLKAFFQH